MSAVTLIAIALAVVTLLVVVGAVTAAVVVTGNAVRASARRETRLEQLLERQDARHLEVLDRVMYSAGKPWKDSADRPEQAAREPDHTDPFEYVVEDPVGGADYRSDLYIGDDLFPGNPGFPDTFDTADLETL